MDYKDLFRKLERNLAEIQDSADVTVTLSAILKRLVGDYRELGITGGRIYARRGSHYVLQKEHPVRRAPRGFKIPASYRPVRELLEHGIVRHDLRDPGVDPDIERTLGVKTFAAIAVGERVQHIMAFSLRPRADREHVVYTLNTIRHVIDSKLRQQQMADRVAEVRAIQMSLLPRSAPVFEGYEVWGATRPAEEVGGDLYDFIAVSPRVLGIAVADSAGHGLPAALQARDAIIGLRMGVEERLRITATIEKLNKVVSHSALASKFISLFYGEVEKNGNMVYVNAGHAPPLLRAKTGLTELTQGGLVLGPSSDALYERGYVTLEPGDVLLSYTDGITEAESPAGEAYGLPRLRDLLLSRSWTGARELVEAVMADAVRFVGSDFRVDDQTVVAVVRRR
jgi:serine phosphatase RsbU (regulator of sigma subunit)